MWRNICRNLKRHANRSASSLPTFLILAGLLLVAVELYGQSREATSVPASEQTAISNLEAIQGRHVPTDPATARASIDVLVGDLKYMDAKVRLRAVMELRRRGAQAKPAIKRLCELLDDKSVVLLADNSAKGHEECQIDREASLTLVAIGKPAVAPLKEVLRGGKKNARAHAAEALSFINERMDVDWARAISDPVPSIRLLAAQQLGKSEGKVAQDALTKALADGDAEVRKAAADGAGKLRAAQAVAPLVELLKDKDPVVADHAHQALGQIGAPSVRALIKVLKDPASGANGQQHGPKFHADWAMRSVRDPNALELLLKALDDEEPLVRVAAAGALTGTELPRVMDALMARAGDSQAKVRQEVMHALGSVHDPTARTLDRRDLKIGKLARQLLRDDPDEYVRATAAQALGGRLYEPQENGKALIPALKDTSALVRACAAEALSHCRVAEAVKPLIQCLKDPDGQVRKASAHALGIMMAKEAVSSLCELLKDANYQVREMAASMLGNIADERAVDPLLDALEAQFAILRAGGHDEVYDVITAIRKSLGIILKVDNPYSIEDWRQWLKTRSPASGKAPGNAK